MNVTSLMSKNIISIDMDDPIRKARDIFKAEEFHHLLVCDKRSLVGVISDRDLLKAISPNVDTVAATDKDLATLNKKAHQIMTRKPISLNNSATMKDAIILFNENKISCIPIIDENHHPVGILSWRDIIKYIANKIEH